MNKTLQVWKLWDKAHLPEYGSEWAACFDLKASLRPDDEVAVYNQLNLKRKRKVNDSVRVELYSDERMLVPTGVVFDLREGESIRIHPRSGLSLKFGIVIANCEGVVDADYVNQTYVMLHNISSEPFDVGDGDRIAQAEVVPVYQVEIVQSDREPEEKTSRTGGFGSTGV
jgi:dUTP pyrophosphatase